MDHNQVPATHFVQTLAANVDNEKLDDAAFREFVRNTLPIVEGNTQKENKRAGYVGPYGDGVSQNDR
jgi:hypothetical protein